MSSPLVFDVVHLLNPSAMADIQQNHGPAPERIGVNMIAIEKGADLQVDATLTPLGDAIMVDATVLAAVSGQCSRCLEPISETEEFTLNEVFSEDADFIQSDPDSDEDDDDDADSEDAIGLINEGTIDLLDALRDEVGLSLEFNPVCEDYGKECSSQLVPEPDGVSGEDEKNLIDPRWAGLEKFQ